MGDLFLNLLNMSITATWIALAVILLRFLLKKSPKWLMGILWGFVALRLICPFSIESVLSLIPSTKTLTRNITAGNRPVVNSGLNFIDNGINNYLGDHYSEGVSVPANTGDLILKIAAIVWIIGVAAMLLYTVISFLSIRKKVNESVRTANGFKLCDRIQTPFILGIIRPEIYIPSSMNQADIEYVLYHENAHIKRKDHLWKPLGFMLLTVYWFNPILWAAYILFCRDIESACDEKVLRENGITIKKPYSEALINCSVSRKNIAACPLAFGETGVKGRVKNVLNYKKPAFWIIIISVIICIILSACLLTNPISKASIPGTYTISENVYCDGAFNYLMLVENAPIIKIDSDMTVYEIKDEEIVTGSTFKEATLSQDNFEDLFNNSEVWQNNENTENIQKQNKTALCTSWQTSESGIFPYMILRQKNDTVYIVYANVENGTATCIRWIYTLNKQNQTDNDTDETLSDFLDITVKSKSRRSGISADPFICTDCKMLGKKKSGSEITFYMWVLYEEFSYDDELQMDSSYYSPVVITANMTSGANGTDYELVDYKTPTDGAGLKDDVKEMFPLLLRSKALDSQRYIDEQKANCLKKAQEHYGITTSVVGGYDEPITTVTSVAESNNPTFSAVILEKNENSILVQPDSNSNEAKSSDQIYVSLSDISNGADFNVGDNVKIEYNGDIAESYPAQINTVYSIKKA